MSCLLPEPLVDTIPPFGRLLTNGSYLANEAYRTPRPRSLGSLGSRPPDRRSPGSFRPRAASRGWRPSRDQTQIIRKPLALRRAGRRKAVCRRRSSTGRPPRRGRCRPAPAAGWPGGSSPCRGGPVVDRVKSRSFRARHRIWSSPCTGQEAHGCSHRGRSGWRIP